jgi:hypothetical protein
MRKPFSNLLTDLLLEMEDFAVNYKYELVCAWRDLKKVFAVYMHIINEAKITHIFHFERVSDVWIPHIF